MYSRVGEETKGWVSPSMKWLNNILFTYLLFICIFTVKSDRVQQTRWVKDHDSVIQHLIMTVVVYRKSHYKGQMAARATLTRPASGPVLAGDRWQAPLFAGDTKCVSKQWHHTPLTSHTRSVRPDARIPFTLPVYPVDCTNWEVNPSQNASGWTLPVMMLPEGRFWNSCNQCRSWW